MKRAGVVTSPISSSGGYNMELKPEIARRIIETLASAGTPPEYGFQYFTVGLDGYLSVIEKEYLESYIKNGGSSFKLIVGTYGSGKTHFLYCVRDLAWKHNYMTSYIVLSPTSTPFYKLELVYKEIVSNLTYPQNPEALLSGYDRGIEAVIKTWYYQKYQELAEKMSKEEVREELTTYASSLGPYESTSFKNAVKEAFISLVENRNDDFEHIIQWLKAEGHDRYHKKIGILEKIDKSTAFRMLRSLAQWIGDICYSGFIVLLDEAEQTPSMSSKQKNILLNNLRELIDACGTSKLKNVMFFYAVPNESFLEGRTQIYEALRQRLATILEYTNPSGVKIDLEVMSIEPLEMLREIGRKLAKIYEIAYNVSFNQQELEEKIDDVAKKAYEERHGEISYRRLFVQRIIAEFHKLRVGST